MHDFKYLGATYSQTRICKHKFLECISLRWSFIQFINDPWNLDYSAKCKLKINIYITVGDDDLRSICLLSSSSTELTQSLNSHRITDH